MSIEQSETYYTSMDYLLQTYDECARKHSFRANTVPEYEAWKREVRSVLSDITGIRNMKKCPLNPKTVESCRMNGYRRDKVILQTESNVWMPFYILIPDGMEKGEKRASVIAAHGHGSAGKYVIAGRDDIPAVKKAIEETRCDYGVKLVKEGYVVFCPDARGSGERREKTEQGEENLFTSSCTALNNAAISLGRSLTGMWTWDLMRLIDYIESCDFCDSTRIGCCGMSGGGLQTLWLAAMDDRVKCAVISGYFHGYKDTLLRTNKCGCNFVPHLWENVDIGDIGALIAPRALLIESGLYDPLNGERGIVDVYEQVEITRNAYQVAGEEQKLQHYVFEGKHQWNGQKTYDFFKKWLGERTDG